jgi:hypothetical protein
VQVLAGLLRSIARVALYNILWDIMPYTAKEKESWWKRYKNTEHGREIISKMRENAKIARQERKLWVDKYKAECGCSRCGEKDSACLEFHHKDPSEKDSAVAAYFRGGWSLKTIQKEISKCEVLCANCHRKLHHSTRCSSKEEQMSVEH